MSLPLKDASKNNLRDTRMYRQNLHYQRKFTQFITTEKNLVWGGPKPSLRLLESYFCKSEGENLGP